MSGFTLPPYFRKKYADISSTEKIIHKTSADCVPILEMGYSGGNDVDGLRISYIVGELVKG